MAPWCVCAPSDDDPFLRDSTSGGTYRPRGYLPCPRRVSGQWRLGALANVPSKPAEGV
jgi:hypothetical protein